MQIANKKYYNLKKMSTKTYCSKLLSYQGRDPKVEYGGDCRFGKQPVQPAKIAPTAWVVGQWLLARKKGQPLSDIANKYCDQALAGTTNKALQWLISSGLNF
jgi:hypothetical protein|tara:strand:+ start:1691 stop:1996 length:306 start_codon:yes stop_codon:yes gene_type:complete